MKQPKPGEWWWVDFDGGRAVAEYDDGVAFIAGLPDAVDFDDPNIVWLGPVAPFAPSPDPAAPDASDDVRLAAGWAIEVVPVFGADDLADNDASDDTSDKDQTPAPGPAGDWRLHVSGRLWVRWVVAS